MIANIVSKLHARLMPTLLMMYVLAFLDRTNIGFAKAGLEADAAISYASYAFGASIFFVGYAFLEVPSNLILHRVGARLWLSRIMVSWGAVSAATAFVHDSLSFYAIRFLLGIAEAGFFPGVIFYLTYWYPASARGRCYGLFYYGAPLALTLGGPFSGLLIERDWAGLHGWQIMFIAEGLLASLAGIAVLFLLKDRPEQASWLRPNEKQALRAALAEDQLREPSEDLTVWRALANSRTLILSALYFLIEMGFYGLTFFLPTQVAKLLGKTMGLEVGLVTALPWAAALAAVTIIPWYCDRKGNYRQVGSVMMVVAALGLAVSALTASALLAILALSAAACGLIVAPAIFWTFPTRVFRGAAAAGSIALINSIGNLGGFVAPNLRAGLEMLFRSASAGLLGLALVCLMAALVFARCHLSDSKETDLAWL